MQGSIKPVKNAPDFNIRVRAQRFTPDMFYVNEFAGRLAQYGKNLLDELFA
jgi:deoxyribodipyrimidine photolyase